MSHLTLTLIQSVNGLIHSLHTSRWTKDNLAAKKQKMFSLGTGGGQYRIKKEFSISSWLETQVIELLMLLFCYVNFRM